MSIGKVLAWKALVTFPTKLIMVTTITPEQHNAVKYFLVTNAMMTTLIVTRHKKGKNAVRPVAAVKTISQRERGSETHSFNFFNLICCLT